MRRLLIGATVALAAGALTVPAQAGPPRQAKSSSSSPAEYVVLYAKSASADAAHAAIEAAGGTIVRENRVVGLATVRTTNANFLKAASGQAALVSAMADRAIGHVPGGKDQTKPDSVENDRSVSATAQATAKAAATARKARTPGSSSSSRPSTR
jgi:hypothetical protein